MREIAYKHLTSAKHKRKIIAINEKAEGKKCNTRTFKKFIYVVDDKVKSIPEIAKPEFTIAKFHNSKKKTEKFLFRVKGTIVIDRDSQQFLVHYSHSLRIDIRWKKKIPVPKTAS